MQAILRASLATSIAVVLGACLAPAHAGHLAPDGADPADRGSTGVLATEDAWSHAEAVGDTAYLERMLAPEYRSVNPDGSVLAKARLVAHAATRKGSDRGLKDMQAYWKAHPSGNQVVVHGDLAIVSFYDPTLGAEKGLRSSDVFVYEHGGWHAIYSQHNPPRA